MSAAQSRRAENVVELFDGVVEGTDSPLVPDGEYLATYLGHDVVELAQFKEGAQGLPPAALPGTDDSWQLMQKNHR